MADRDQDHPWRRWYDSPDWHRLRDDVRRDAQMRCRMCGRLCYGVGNHEAAPVVDHVTPHKGDRDLFLDRDNLQLLCKRCHDGPKARQESRGYHDLMDGDGWPIDPRHPANRVQ